MMPDSPDYPGISPINMPGPSGLSDDTGNQYVRLMTSRSIRAIAFDTASSNGDFAWRSANSSWRSSEYSAFIALIASPMSTLAGSGIRSSASPDDQRYAKSM